MGLDMGNLGNLAAGGKDLTALPKMWDDVKGKNWTDFHERIQTARDNHEAEPEQLNKVEEASHQAESSGKEFPHSLPDLMSTLGDHMPK